MPRRIVLEPIRDPQVGTEVADTICRVDAAIKALLRSGLSERALLVLVHDALPRGSKLTVAQIKDVIAALDGLRARYVTRRS